MKQMMGLAAGVLVLLAAGSARAQGTYQRPQTNPFGTPAVSPYLNLNRPGLPGINYFNLVQPQVETYNHLQQLETATLHTAALVQAEANDPNRRVIETGGATRFMSYSQYFQNVGGQHPSSPAITAPVFAPAATTLNRGGR
jgi:hypothetical protein